LRAGRGGFGSLVGGATRPLLSTKANDTRVAFTPHGGYCVSCPRPVASARARKTIHASMNWAAISIVGTTFAARTPRKARAGTAARKVRTHASAGRSLEQSRGGFGSLVGGARRRLLSTEANGTRIAFAPHGGYFVSCPRPVAPVRARKTNHASMNRDSISIVGTTYAARTPRQARGKFPQRER
jgi:hypothetical protein